MKSIINTESDIKRTVEEELLSRTKNGKKGKGKVEEGINLCAV